MVLGPPRSSSPADHHPELELSIVPFLAWVVLAGTNEAQVEADHREIKAREARIVID